VLHLRTIPLCALLAVFTSTSASAQERQHPYFPLTRGTTWTYRYPPSANDPDQRSSETRKVVQVDTAENTYAVEHTVRLLTLPPTTTALIYEIRGGYVLNLGQTDGGGQEVIHLRRLR
jgi:hypothetical protein